MSRSKSLSSGVPAVPEAQKIDVDERELVLGCEGAGRLGKDTGGDEEWDVGSVFGANGALEGLEVPAAH